MKSLFYYLALSVILAGCAGPLINQSDVNAEAVGTVSLNGLWKYRHADLAPENGYLPELDDSDWSTMNLPGNWYLAGEEYSGAMWFRRTISLESVDAVTSVSMLVFEGVDYTTDVWINGRYVGFHEGYFQPFRFEVNSLLQPGSNVIAVRVNSPAELPGTDWSLRKRLIKGIFSHHDTRPGNAWSERGQEGNTGGIWGDVSLNTSRFLGLDSLRVSGKINYSDTSAVLDVSISALSVLKEGTYQIQAVLEAHNFKPEKQTLYRTNQFAYLMKGANKVRLNLSVPDARLWWSWDQGHPNLYKLKISVYRDGVICDEISDLVGIREIRYEEKTGTWFLNERRLFLRGTNYIATQWLSEMDQESFQYDVSLMRRANINTVRVHAHVTAREFYNRCDASGMMVWQDFPLQWGYEDTEVFEAEAVRQGRDMLLLFYNHASIIAWSLHNEPPWDADWMVYKYNTWHHEMNKRLDRQLLKRLSGVDSTRYLHPYSATKEHLWQGWYSGSWLDHMARPNVKIISEFGAQALPDMAALRRIFTEDELWPDSEAEWRKWDFHNFQRKETFETAGVPMGKTIEELIDNTQTYQAKLIKLACESYRRMRYQPAGSIFQFMFVENWPSVNWGVVDYWRQPKSGYEALRLGYQPVLPSIEWSKEHWQKGETVGFDFWVINDLYKRFPGAELKFTLRGTEGVVESGRVMLNIEPDSGQKVFSWEKGDLPVGEYTLILLLYNNKGTLLGENEHSYSVK